MTAAHPDVIVVGARSAGAATAMLLARAGHDVVVLDRSWTSRCSSPARWTGKPSACGTP
jgi:glycine/D-amino acid oxidase-like deaminating enzyme